MEHAISIANSRVAAGNQNRFVMDTTFVLFFLAMDIGASFRGFGFDMILSGITLAMFVAVPYLLPFAGEKPDFTAWAIGRVFIAMIGIIAGVTLALTSGTILPGSARYLPMTLLIIAGIFCAITQMYAMLKLRLAR